MKKTLFIARTGDPVPNVATERGPFEKMIVDTLGDAWDGDVKTFDAREGAPPAPDAMDALVITGSAANVPNRDAWIVAMEEWLTTVFAAEVPTFGICFGHQILAQALGGSAEKNPKGREMGSIEVERFADAPIFEGLPTRFWAQATHVDSALVLPPNAVALARSGLDAHQAIRFPPTCYGVQFHPEFDERVIKGYMTSRRAILEGEGRDVDAMLDAVCAAPHAATTLRNFVRYVVPR